jgi:hypothetical protein
VHGLLPHGQMARQLLAKVFKQMPETLSQGKLILRDLVKTSMPSAPRCPYFSVIAVNPVMSATMSAPSKGVVWGT